MNTRKQKEQDRLTLIVEDFNRRFPVGTPVILQKASGPVVTSVRSPAELLGGHTPVAWFTGVSGCYSIAASSVRLLTREEEPVSVPSCFRPAGRSQPTL